jgi:AcrR family transcriptional regulator
VVVVSNRHELRRRATRDALRQAALEQFAERGFDAVTVAQVAEEVGVTERTFYRHFPTKESILFQDYENRLDWLATALGSRPATESVFDAILAAVQTFPHEMEIVRQAAMLRTSLISGDRVADHLRIVQSSFSTVLTEFMDRRLPANATIDRQLFATVAGNAIAGALIAAIEVWGMRGCVDDVQAMVYEAIDVVRSGLRPLV